MTGVGGEPLKLAATSLLLIALAVEAVAAQQFPSRNLRFVGIATPGTTSDIIGRTVGEPLSRQIGQSVVVENRAGAGGTLAAGAVARAEPDGHTLLLTSSAQSGMTWLYAQLPFDPVKDFSGVTPLAELPSVLAVPTQRNWSSLKDLVAAAKAKPGALNFGSPGALTSGHLTMELLNLTAGIKIQHVPYKGGAPAISDLIGGSIQFVVLGPPTVMAHIKAGRLKAIATTAAKRSPGLPETPTFAESGMPGWDTYEWYGIFGPAKMPRSVVLKLNTEINRILKLPDVNERFLQLGAIPHGNTVEEFTAFLDGERKKWGPVAQKVGLRPN